MRRPLVFSQVIWCDDCDAQSVRSGNLHACMASILPLFNLLCTQPTFCTCCVTFIIPLSSTFSPRSETKHKKILYISYLHGTTWIRNGAVMCQVAYANGIINIYATSTNMHIWNVIKEKTLLVQLLTVIITYVRASWCVFRKC